MNLEKLKGHIPEAVIAQIPGVMEKFQINTPLRLSHFLAQCGHESGGFRLTKASPAINTSGLTTVKFSVFGSTNSGGFKIRVILKFNIFL